MTNRSAMTIRGRRIRRTPATAVLAILIAAALLPAGITRAAPLTAGVAKVDIGDPASGPADGPLYARALVIKNDATVVAIITVDAVAIGEIGPIGNDYLGTVRERIKKEIGIDPRGVLVGASHCHGRVCPDVADRTVQAVKTAAGNMVPVKIAAGAGREDRIMENRRLKLRDGRAVDVRHAYSLPSDEAVAAIGPADPEIGILRLDRQDGRPLAIVYNFACHPIQGVPSGANTSDMTGFASKVIEENLGPGAVALFLQGCAGDINPVFYKDVDHPRDAEPLGNLLGLSTLRAVRKLETKEDARLTLLHEIVALPRADFSQRIAAMEAEQKRLVESLKGTSLNLKTFLPLAVKYKLSDDFPSYYSHGYLREKAIGRDDLSRLDAENRRNIEQYIGNIHTMEQLTRLQTNLALLRKHQAANQAAGKPTIDVELLAMRIGDFVLLTFPGELTVEIGLGIKKHSPHEHTFVAGYSNGYIYYCPTAEQLRNPGAAQEDSDCLLAPEWQRIYETKAAEMLRKL